VVRGFSRGMLQRLSIARALLHAPDILLLDEPFTGLDLNGVEVLSGLVEAKRAAGCTVVLTTHDPAHALRLCERWVVLARGGLVADSPISAFATPEALAAAYTEAIETP
jgi:heme exporter protein A